MTQQRTLQIEREFVDFYHRCEPFTMVDMLKCHNLYTAVVYCERNGVAGAFVECGVWRGGSAMLMALTARAHGDGARDICLYDTFAGMTEPQEIDIRFDGERARDKWVSHQTPTGNDWCCASLEEARNNLMTTGYDPDRLHFIRGPVEETIPAASPDSIAILRLDTDFFASTYHELVHLYPRLVPGGVLILDDYHYWQGQRQAVDRYLEENDIGLMLTSTSTSATGVKTLAHGGPHTPPPRTAAREVLAGTPSERGGN